MQPSPIPLRAVARFCKSAIALWLTLSCIACGDTLPIPQHRTPDALDAAAGQLGTLSLALQDEALGHLYRLKSATFQLTGPISKTLQQVNGDSAEQLSTELEVGSYNIRLEPGWQLVNEADRALEASVRAEQIPFEVAKSKTSSVRFEFVVNENAPPPAGSLNVSFQVTETPKAGVVFSEFMPDPAAHADSGGEWLELTNLSREEFSLDGCVVSRDTQHFTIAGAYQIAAGATFTLANGAEPGFTPSFVYQSLSLPNSAAYVISLTCGGKLIDSVSVSPDTWHTTAGKSFAYYSASPSAEGNDTPEHWCNPTVSYGMDLGSPGQLNPACP